MMDLDHCLKIVANYYANMNFSPYLYGDLYNGLRFRNRKKAIQYLKGFLVGLNLTMETRSV